MNSSQRIGVILVCLIPCAMACIPDLLGGAGLPDPDTELASVYGDGSAGSRVISSDQQLRDANRQFTDFTIDAGVTMTVQSGMRILCTGTFTNNGAIVVLTGVEGGDRQGFDGTSVEGATRAANPGIAQRAAGSGEAGDNQAGRLGGFGGDGISDVEGGGTITFGPNAGGGGGPGLNSEGGGGGGSFTVAAKGAIVNNGAINADGGDGESGAGGGGGGVVVLASPESVTHSASGAIAVNGGAGGGSGDDHAAGGGGGGGIVRLVSPTITNDGAMDVTGGSAGATGAAGSITAQTRAGGGGGGATAGDGGNGGGVGAGANADPGTAAAGAAGFVLEQDFDPTALL